MQDDYKLWKIHPITVYVYKALQELRDDVNLQLTNAENIMGSEKKLARLLGNREALDIILNLEYEDVGDEIRSDRTQSPDSIN